MKSITVYSCSYGDFHPPPEPKRPDPECSYICFTDSSEKVSPESVWEYRVMRLQTTPRRASRFAKILADYCLYTDFSIYVDAGLVLTETPDNLIAELGNCDIGIFRHTRRRYIMQEALQIGKRFPELADAAVEQAKRLSKFPRTGLAECGLIVRRNNVRTLAFNHIWWGLFSLGPERDQLSFPCAAELSDVRIKWFEKEISNNGRCCSVERWNNETWCGFKKEKDTK